MLRPFEHQVFEQVRERCGPGCSFFDPTWYQMLTATIAAVILVHDHIEPVRQLMVHEWNVHGGKTGTKGWTGGRGVGVRAS